MTTIGEYVKETRETLGISQSTLSQRTVKLFGKRNAASRSHISELETGSKGMSLSKVTTIFQALLSFTK